MELRDFLLLLVRRRRLLVLSTLLGGVSGIIAATVIPPSYEARVDMYVVQEAGAPSPDFFSYDGFYAHQTSREMADTVTGLFQSHALLQESIDEASFPMPADLDDVLDHLSVRKTAPAVLSVRFTHASSSHAAALLQHLTARVLDTLTPSDAVVLLNEEPLMRTRELPPIHTALAGAVLGLFCAMVVVAGTVYFYGEAS